MKFKNKILNEFFNNDGYVLAFSQKFEPGWMGEANKEQVASIFKKIGNEYIQFNIDDKIAKRTYVLEQKFWKEEYYKPILEKKFGKDLDKLEESFSEEMFQKKKIKIKNYNRFKRDFIRLLFANYYN